MTRERNICGRNRQARELFRRVDHQLKHGPRRALAELAKIESKLPIGTKKQASEYMLVLKGVIERAQLVSSDFEAEQEERFVKKYKHLGA